MILFIARIFNKSLNDNPVRGDYWKVQHVDGFMTYDIGKIWNGAEWLISDIVDREKWLELMYDEYWEREKHCDNCSSRHNIACLISKHRSAVHPCISNDYKYWERE